MNLGKAGKSFDEDWNCPGEDTFNIQCCYWKNLFFGNNDLENDAERVLKIKQRLKVF